MAWGSDGRGPVARTPLPDAAGLLPESTIALFLNSGADERVARDPVTGRSRYGTAPLPAEDEIWFSSSTASTLDRRSFSAAARVLSGLIGSDPVRGTDLRPSDITSWFDQIRARLLALFGPDGSEAVLTPSGTEAEYTCLGLVLAILERPLTNIVVAPTETGCGVMSAASGQHFLTSSSLGGPVAAGALLEGFDRVPIETQTIAIRDSAGYPRETEAIDHDAAELVAAALAAGRDVLLHVLDASKTGLAGVTRQTAQALMKQSDGRLVVVVDACQLRCQPAQLRQDLEVGFMVAITGSKFAGGPPFCGALLVPTTLLARLPASARAPAGLSGYSARFDWPEALRGDFVEALATSVNLGLGLRWEAALAAIEPYFALPEVLRKQILSWFAGTVHRRVTARRHLRLIPAEPSRAKTIIPVETLGPAATPEGAAILYAALASPHAPLGGPPKLAKACHVGQPVPIGERAALRICASMPTVLDVAGRMLRGESVESSVAPIIADLDILFAKWDWLVGAAHIACS